MSALERAAALAAIETAEQALRAARLALEVAHRDIKPANVSPFYGARSNPLGYTDPRRWKKWLVDRQVPIVIGARGAILASSADVDAALARTAAPLPSPPAEDDGYRAATAPRLRSVPGGRR